jgi:hexosaminidase
MAMVKLNCLHWHLTDDESFPWQLADLPELADKGAFAPEAVYTVGDIREVVEYARFRGIRVIPELDTPGEHWRCLRIVCSVLLACAQDCWGVPCEGGDVACMASCKWLHRES